jgi:hypothetical protein
VRVCLPKELAEAVPGALSHEAKQLRKQIAPLIVREHEKESALHSQGASMRKMNIQCYVIHPGPC